MTKKFFLSFAAAMPLILPIAAHAAEASYTVEVKDGAFVPATVSVPAGQKVKLTVKNDDKVGAEFESTTLNREQKVGAGESVDIFVGPLDKGTYEYFDDNNPNATGKIIAQ